MQALAFDWLNWISLSRCSRVTVNFQNRVELFITCKYILSSCFQCYFGTTTSYDCLSFCSLSVQGKRSNWFCEVIAVLAEDMSLFFLYDSQKPKIATERTKWFQLVYWSRNEILDNLVGWYIFLIVPFISTKRVVLLHRQRKNPYCVIFRE